MRKKISILMMFLISVFCISTFAFADSERIVTLGEDLTKQQQAKILKYFGVSRDDVRIIYVNNDEEREFLSSYIPLSVIGTRTLSCAYVKPTSSGGINVKTANLNWVTANMIASALTTAGVRNCDVIAACPIEVSGTGALTGVIKAYEHASNTTLEPEKKNTAAHEISTYNNVAQTIGQNQATQVINDIKIEIIENNIQPDDDEKITEVIDGALYSVGKDTDSLTDEEVNDLYAYASEIASQGYDYDEMKETLETVEENVKEDGFLEGYEEDVSDEYHDDEEDEEEEFVDDVETEEKPKLEEDSILKNTDDSALGDDVIMEATTEDAFSKEEDDIDWDETDDDFEEYADSDIEDITESDVEEIEDYKVSELTEEDMHQSDVIFLDTIFNENSLVLYSLRDDIAGGHVILQNVETGDSQIYEIDENTLVTENPDDEGYMIFIETDKEFTGDSYLVYAEVIFDDGTEEVAEQELLYENSVVVTKSDDGKYYIGSFSDERYFDFKVGHVCNDKLRESEKTDDGIMLAFDDLDAVRLDGVCMSGDDYLYDISLWVVGRP